ncbi:hypothetical protein HD806DRAFT_504955 [Xylariaceae sp. AK1471]|nr:hypothetical protein HD806DRAFT_504955 [Xylariaceae sp. AK1471]
MTAYHTVFLLRHAVASQFAPCSCLDTRGYAKVPRVSSSPEPWTPRMITHGIVDFLELHRSSGHHLASYRRLQRLPAESRCLRQSWPLRS